MYDNETVTVYIDPRIDQLRLIFIIAILLLIAWFYSLFSYNKAELREISWCLDWNERTQSDWYYDIERGCVVNDE